jgi:hypothetical protein
MTSAQSRPIVIQPNQFIAGGYNIGITYETTSLTGTPRLSYTRQGQTVTFTGEEIQTEQTQLGQMVTVNLSGKFNQIAGFYGNNPGSQGLIGINLDNQDSDSIAQKPDETIERLTLLVPLINLPQSSLEGPVQMQAIFSLLWRTTKAPDQLQYYMPLYLYGTAKRVEF